MAPPKKSQLKNKKADTLTSNTYCLVLLDSNTQHIMCNSDHVCGMKAGALTSGDAVIVKDSRGHNDPEGGKLTMQGSQDQCASSLKIIQDYENLRIASKRTVAHDSNEEEQEDEDEPPARGSSAVAASDSTSLPSLSPLVDSHSTITFGLERPLSPSYELFDFTQTVLPFKEPTQPEVMTPRTAKRKMAESEGDTSKQFEYSAKTFRFLLGENTRLEREAAIFRQEWMPKPNDLTTVNWFTNTARLLNNNGAADDDDDEKENAGERLADVADVLDLEHDELDNCRVSGSITATARRVLALKYPPAARITMTFGDVPNGIKKAVRDYVRIIHKQKSSTCSDGKLNSAMGNIFASEVHRQSLIREGAKQALDERRKEEVTIISNDGKGNE